MSAVDNLSAVPAAERSNLYGHGPIAGSVAGLGAAEVRRHEPTEGEAAEEVAAEIRDRLASAAEYERLGQSDRAVALRTEAGILKELLRALPPS